MKQSILIVSACALALTFLPVRSRAHCQIPCGIYDDPARFVLLEEHITTIEKSMTLIKDLAGKHDAADQNQMTRWVMNKERHADEFTEIVTFYFMAQRIKPTDASDRAAYRKYLRQVELLHHMIVHAMKAKQTVDLEQTAKLRELVKEFKGLYLAK